MSEFVGNRVFPSASSLEVTLHSESLVDTLKDYTSEVGFWLKNKSFTAESLSILDSHKFIKGNVNNSFKFKIQRVKKSNLITRSKFKKSIAIQRYIKSDNNYGIVDTSNNFSISKRPQISRFNVPRYTKLFNKLVFSSNGINHLCSDYFNMTLSLTNFVLNERYYNIPLLNVNHYKWHQGGCKIQDFIISLEYIPLFDDNVISNTSNLVSPVLTELSLKKSQYQKQLLVDPSNESLWIEFAESDFVSNSIIFGFENVTIDKSSRTMYENSIKIFNKALSINPQSICLISKYMSLYDKLYDYGMVVLKWRQFLFTFPQSSILWNQYTNFILHSFDYFNLDELVKIFQSAFKTLISIVEEEFLSSTPELDAEKNLVSLVLKYCHILMTAGYEERAISSVISLIHFNSMTTNSVLKKQDLIIEFESIWSTRNLISSKRHDLFSFVTPCHIPNNSSNSNNEIFGLVDDLHKSWVTVELNRSKSWSIVPQSLLEGREVIDHEKIIPASVLLPLLFTLHSTNHIFQLLLHSMLLLGLPISMTSQVDKTFLNDEGFVVEIDANDWICLFPLYFRGTIIISSTNTKKLAYNTSALTTEQITLICNLLNYTLPRLDCEHQTVLIITWLEYQINCLGYKLDDFKSNAFFREQIKSILKLDIHKNNMALWGAYMIIYSYVSTLRDLLNIPATILLQFSNSELYVEKLFCFHYLLHLCTSLEKRLSNNTSNFQLYLLECISSNSTPQLNAMLSLLQERSKIYSLSYSQILIIKQNIWERTKFNLKSKECTLRISLLYSSIYLTTEFLLNKIQLGQCCVNSQSLMKICDSLFMSCLPQYKDVLFVFSQYTIIKQILWFLKCDYVPKYIANFLQEMFFPNLLHNPHLYKLLLGEFRLNSINLRLREDFTLNEYICKLSFHMNMLIHEIDTSSRQYIINKLKITLDKALQKYSSTLTLWLFYVDFMKYIGTNGEDYSFFFQAIKKLPGVKRLYTEWVSLEPKRISFIFSLLEEKGIRICCPIEEFKLMQEAIL